MKKKVYGHDAFFILIFISFLLTALIAMGQEKPDKNRVFLLITTLITDDGQEQPVIDKLLVQKGKTKVHKKRIERAQKKGEYVASIRDKEDSILFKYYFQFPKIRTIPPPPPGSAKGNGRDVLKINNPQVILTIPYHEDTASITLSRSNEEKNILVRISIDKADDKTSKEDSNSTHSSPSSDSTRNNSPSPPPPPSPSPPPPQTPSPPPLTQDMFNVLIISSDYYTDEEKSNFISRAQEIKNAILSVEPFIEYSYGVDINIYHNTDALDCYCGDGGIARLMNCNEYKIISAATASGHLYDEIIIIHNTSDYCGGGIRDSGSYNTNSYSTFAMVYDGQYSSSMALHEFGHSFADLCDEYSYGNFYNTYYDCVNCRVNCNDWASLNQACNVGCDARPQYYSPENSIMFDLSYIFYNQASIKNGIIPILQNLIPPLPPPSIKGITIQ